MNLYFFFWIFWYNTQQYHGMFVYIVAVLMVIVNVFQLYLAVDYSFNVIFFMVFSNNKRKLPANNQNLEMDPLIVI